MAFSVNPLQFKTDKLDTDPQRKSFLGRLGDLLNQITINLLSAQFLASVLNANPQLFNSALVFKNTSLVNVATNQTVDCTGAVSVAVYMSINTAVNLTLTLNNLQIGVPIEVAFDNQAVAAQTFKLACNTPTPTAYTIRGIQAGGAGVDLTATGVTPNAGNRAVFASTGTPGARLYGILQS